MTSMRLTRKEKVHRTGRRRAYVIEKVHMGPLRRHLQPQFDTSSSPALSFNPPPLTSGVILDTWL